MLILGGHGISNIDSELDRAYQSLPKREIYLTIGHYYSAYFKER